MGISDLHASHIRRVSVEFDVAGPTLDPAELTRATGLTPDRQALRGQPRTNYAGQVVGTHEAGWWRLASAPRVTSKDVNPHFEHLLDLLLPHAILIRKQAEGGEVLFGILWESTYLYSGTGPVLSARVCGGVAALGGAMAFDIYAVDDDD